MLFPRNFWAALLVVFLVPVALGITTPPLQDAITGNQISEGVRNLIVCIHGWNNPPANDVYHDPSGEWPKLVSALTPELQAAAGEQWSLLLYDWHQDAATGPVFDLENNISAAFLHGTQAALNASAHGITLGARLPTSLRRVHFITHSAGAWAAYRAAYSLMNLNKYVVV